MSSSEEQSQSESQKQIIDLTNDQQQQQPQELKKRKNTKIAKKIFNSQLYYEKRIVNLTVKERGTEDDDDDDKQRKRKFTSKTKDTEDINDYFFLFKFDFFFDSMKFLSEFIYRFDNKSLSEFITTYEKIYNDLYKYKK
jgi:hypothetical protein